MPGRPLAVSLLLVAALGAVACSSSAPAAPAPAARCGDGHVDAGEPCDDGNSINSDACLTACKLAVCGDGVVRAGVEACDDGAANSDSAANACRSNCSRPRCGDGVVDAGEGCDDGAANSETDPNACRTSCRLPSCGDGALDPGEPCDDGNNDDTDGCLSTCVLASCGDGQVRVGVEQCEPSIPIACGASCGEGQLECTVTCQAGACLVLGDGEACAGPGILTVGPCRAAWSCGSPGPGPGGLTCTQTVGPRAETCNNVDDDCDGTTDNDPTDVGVACCAAGALADCWVLGSTACQGGGPVCLGSIPKSTCTAEVACCSTGTVSDCQNSGAGTRCGTGLTVCSTGTAVCTGSVARSAETCNGVDDDCNGVLDDVTGIGEACSAPGLLTTGSCRAALACDGTPGPGPNGLTCTQAVGPRAETCNGLDDDCDGTTDNDVTDVGLACCSTGTLSDCQNSGAGSRCGTGLTVCSTGTAVCTGSVARSAETCNGVDDDCNGVIDDVTGIGVACSGPGLLTMGNCEASLACDGAPGPGPNGLTCTQAVGPRAEVCNGLDDDCDGAIDNGPTDVGGPCCAFSSCTTPGTAVCQSPGQIICIGSIQ